MAFMGVDPHTNSFTGYRLVVVGGEELFTMFYLVPTDMERLYLSLDF